MESNTEGDGRVEQEREERREGREMNTAWRGEEVEQHERKETDYEKQRCDRSVSRYTKADLIMSSGLLDAGK